MSRYAIMVTMLKLETDVDVRELTKKLSKSIARFKGVGLVASKLGAFDTGQKPHISELATVMGEVGNVLIQQAEKQGSTRKKQ